MNQRGLTRNSLLLEINKLEKKEKSNLTDYSSLVRGFKNNYWRAKLVKKISVVLGVDLLPFVPEPTGQRQKDTLNRIFKEAELYDKNKK